MTPEEKKLAKDVLVLVGRLYGEDPDTFSPETREVMDRWAPRFEEILSNPGALVDEIEPVESQA